MPSRPQRPRPSSSPRRRADRLAPSRPPPPTPESPVRPESDPHPFRLTNPLRGRRGQPQPVVLTPVGAREPVAGALIVALRRVDVWARGLGALRIRRAVRRGLRLLARGLALWRRSLQVRVVTLTMVLGLVATSIVGAVLADQVGNTLLAARRAQAFRDSDQATTEFVRRMSTYTEEDSGPIEGYVRESLDLIKDTGGDSSLGVLLLRQPTDEPAEAQASYASGSLDPAMVPENLRALVEGTTTQQSRSVLLTGDNAGEPGLVVGSGVDVPTAGRYELYFVVSLRREQATLDSVQRVLGAGMTSLVLLLGLIAWLVSRQVVRPVQEAARVAGRLSEGNLDERMNPRGRDELARLARSFNDMADSLQDQIEAMAELSRLQRRFVSDVSHELRTPLTTIRMAAEVIGQAREDFDPVVARSSELLSTQLDRFEDLLADLLEISRFDAGAAALEADPTDLGRLVHQVVDLAVPLADAKGSVIEVHAPDEPVLAEVDARRIERVVRNLVVNAIEHGDGRPVEVWVAGTPDTASVLVVDHGVGLRPGDEERVFDRFWRADPARARTTGGTGLGLAISLEDAHLHGGTLQAWGRPGEGARFLLAVPARAGGMMGVPPLHLEPSWHRQESYPPVPIQGGVTGSMRLVPPWRAADDDDDWLEDDPLDPAPPGR